MKNETLGQVFKRYREAEDLRLERVEKDTNISQRMLNAIENNDYASFPDELYIRNLIKAYAKYLSLDFNKLLNLYDKGKAAMPDTQQTKKPDIKTRVYITPGIIRFALISLIIILVIGYLSYEVNKIFQPPELTVAQPSENIIIDENFIEIKGQTEKEARVYINEKEVFLDGLGEFKATLDLQKGINLIKITSVKKHSRENVVFREILVQ
jgi:transcriptional regulator with XRE-family HTH domain